MVNYQVHTVKVIVKPKNDGPPAWTTTTYTSTITQAASIGDTVTPNTALAFTEPDETSTSVYNPHGLLAFQMTACCKLSQKLDSLFLDDSELEFW